MTPTDQQSISKCEAVVFLGVATVIVALLQMLFYSVPTPAFDALRYVDYALNIHEHGVFGTSGVRRELVPAPNYTSSPLYPAFLASAMWIDPMLQETLHCVASHRGPEVASCSQNYFVAVLLQNMFAIGALFFVWAASRVLFRRYSIALIACVLVLASTKLLFFADRLLTEIIVLFLFAGLMFALVLARRGLKPWRVSVIGLVVGLLALTRPEYMYLGYTFMLAGIGITLVYRSKKTAIATAYFVLSLGVVVGPWLARNYYHFDKPVITGGYGDVVIAHRTAYNRMSTREWAAAFIYWLPGHGESLARRFLPESSYARLGTGPDTYIHVDSKEIFDNGLAAVDGDRERLTSYLIQTEILNHPVKHAMISIPLAWRGVLAGKYLAIAGLPCAIILMLSAARRRQMDILILAAPAAIMIALYATISVSIPRYNVYLIYYYAIACAWAVVGIVDFQRRRIITN